MNNVTVSKEEPLKVLKENREKYVQDKWISQSEKNILRTFALSSSNSALYA